MTTSISEHFAGARFGGPVSAIRARAAADARFLRALARSARVDGLPHSELRATNARIAARNVLDHARRMSSLIPAAIGGIQPAEMVD
ncbi:hypothetical protein [Methylobacterium gnaphalii]|uniref:Uncharacterized protein n=1 Tax=Methylobacterium gnaphalii TaxID=1010610 RepID=A0A512JNR6_9HYPH|nr:hypothetical protein [Methylobacterium gnaphalii]GEP11582.1 hypothetical protein MGN01_34270 [Methylobacterium gnaphalii]GJD70323.1 hypothetical protein MMMDOFMJ_3269 [Methylobacterium gnaphalii]GLS47217.1 hypothetical protein GCM10007885_00610 [Methylobacterium gnaphalii]